MGPAEPCSSIQLCSHSPRPWPSSPWVLFASFPLLLFFYPSLLKVLMDGNMKALSREVPHFYFWSRLQWVCHEKCGNNKISSNNENQQSSLLSSFPFLPITNSSIQHSSARAGNNNNNEKEKKKRFKYNRFSFGFFQDYSNTISNHGSVPIITSSADFTYHRKWFILLKPFKVILYPPTLQ